MARRVLVVGIVVLLVGGAAVAADQALRLTAERRIAGPLARTLGAGPGTQVRIAEDRPFLLQLAGGRLDRVTATADELTLDGTRVADVRMVASGVTIRAPYTAREVAVTGTVPTAALEQRATATGLDATVTVAGGELHASGTVLGLPWTVALVPVADGDRVSVNPTSADIAGVQVAADALPASVKGALAGMDLPVSGLPAGLAISGAQVVGTGVLVTLAGRDVVLHG